MPVKVSVIVPVHNSQNTIAGCLDSLVNQTLQEIRIIAVNDASTDQSLNILEQYALQYHDKLRIINSGDNLGAGGARNLGIKEAEGEYIGFVDSDDMVDVHMFEKLYQKAVEEDYDMVDTAFYNTETGKAVISVDDIYTGVMTPDKRKKLIIVGGYIWSRIYKRDFLEKNGICFRPGVKLEDADFLIKANLAAGRIANVKEVLYVYNNTKTSASWSVNKADDKEFYNIVELIKAVGGIFSVNPEYENYRTELEAIILRLYGTAVQCCIKEGGVSAENLMKIKEARNIKKDIVKGGYDNPYIGQSMGNDVTELLKYIDGLEI